MSPGQPRYTDPSPYNCGLLGIHPRFRRFIYLSASEPLAQEGEVLLAMASRVLLGVLINDGYVKYDLPV